MSLAGAFAHTASVHAASAGLLPYLLTDGRPLAIAITMYYAVKAVIFLLATVVAICTKNQDRRKACLEIVQAVSRGWPLPRLPGSQT